MLAAPSTATHVYTLPLDIGMLVVAEWWGNMSLGTLSPFHAGYWISISENTAATPALMVQP